MSWKRGLQKLVWTIGGAEDGSNGVVVPSGALRMNATVWYSRNTTGDAPSNSPPLLEPGDSVHCPDKSRCEGRVLTCACGYVVPSFINGCARPGFESWRGQSDTLVIHHNGHSPCNGGASRSTDCTDCTPNFDTAQVVVVLFLLLASMGKFIPTLLGVIWQDWFNQLGYDVMELAMPLHGCNRIPVNIHKNKP